MEHHEPDYDLWDYEKAIYDLMTKPIQTVFAEYNRQIEALRKTVRKKGEEYVDVIHLWTEEVKSRIRYMEYFKKVQGETFRYQILIESLEDYPKDTTSWTIGQEQNKKENTPNKSSPETVVQDVDGYILTKVKEEEQYDHLSETHLIGKKR